MAQVQESAGVLTLPPGLTTRFMMRKLLSGLLTIGVLAVLGFYVWLHREEAGGLVLVSPPALGLCAGAVLAGMLGAERSSG